MDLSSQSIPIEERLDFYLNAPRDSVQVALSDDIYNGPKRMYEKNRAVFEYRKYQGSFIEWYSRKLIHRTPFKKLRSLPRYEKYRNLLTLSDFLKLFRDSPNNIKKGSFLLYHGEKELEDDRPYIRKARKINDEYGVLFKLSTIRHFFPCKLAMKHDIDWKEKSQNVVWRGATTSKRYRDTFVQQYFDLFDIGFSTTKQTPELINYRRPSLSIKEQLKFKFIVSLEGYDLASNLKWILSSNSVPIMPKPTWVSWIMEHKLEPYVHYLPLNDQLNNLSELLAWAKENDKACMRIAQNGKAYMNQFFNEKEEAEIQHELLARYVNLFKLNTEKK